MTTTQKLAEGIVTHCNDRYARVWIEAEKAEKEIYFDYGSRNFDLGDWLMASTKRDDFFKIKPCLETRVSNASGGVVQVKTEVVFGKFNEKIRHGTIITSKHFGRVAVFTPFTGIVADTVYRVFVERIPRGCWNEQENCVYWFVSSNQIPDRCRQMISFTGNVQLSNPLVGVVVSKTERFTFVWTPTLGEGICSSDENLTIGKWIKFMFSSCRGYRNNKNINFHIVNWTSVDPILECFPINNNLMLLSTIFVSCWPMDNLVADWVGSVIDQKNLLSASVREFGTRKTYKVMLRRMKRNYEDPITVWHVDQVLECMDLDRRSGIVCLVDIKKSISSVYIPTSSYEIGRLLYVDLKMSSFSIRKIILNSDYSSSSVLLCRFTTVPALGDWFLFELDENDVSWKVKTVMKCCKLCSTRIVHDQLEVETEIMSSSFVSNKGICIMYSDTLGPVECDSNIPFNTTLLGSGKCTVWCSFKDSTAPNDPFWKVVDNFAIPHIVDSKADENAQNFGGNRYIGIIIAKWKHHCYIWTTVGNCIYNEGYSLKIGDWVLISISQSKINAAAFFPAKKGQKIQSIFTTTCKDSIIVVTVELIIPANYIARKPPLLPFFGKVMDRKRWFEVYIDEIRGHLVEVNITPVRNGKCASDWDIVNVSIKDALNGSVSNRFHPNESKVREPTANLMVENTNSVAVKLDEESDSNPESNIHSETVC
ncbi:unnamed protein product [Thelazia callipaeda]|uniref:Tudor domain-containing protein n=1 Tax=Thelazia callipaeda TaxID=103827 RepID=A0A0N5CPM9_THECL|nr:unnamed protein product [Thelazia callipaeda]